MAPPKFRGYGFTGWRECIFAQSLQLRIWSIHGAWHSGVLCSPLACWHIIRERPRGVENSGGWKTYRKFGEKPLPKNVFGPPTYDTFPPPLFWRLSVISLKRKRHRPDQPQFLRPPKVVLESTLCSTFSPPPPNSRDTFCPPLSRCPTLRV